MKNQKRIVKISESIPIKDMKRINRNSKNNLKNFLFIIFGIIFLAGMSMAYTNYISNSGISTSGNYTGDVGNFNKVNVGNVSLTGNGNLTMFDGSVYRGVSSGTADVVVCRGTSTADDVYKSSKILSGCDVVCKSTDSIDICTTKLNNTVNVGNQDILIKKGQYLINNYLFINSNTSITGENKLTELKNNLDTPILYSLNKENIEISGIYINGNFSLNSNNIDIRGSKNIYIHNNKFDNSYFHSAVCGYNSINCHLFDNEVGYTLGFGCTENVTGCYIENNYAFKSSGDFWIMANGNSNKCHQVVVSNNYNYYGNLSFPISTGGTQAGGGIDVSADDYNIIGNIATNCGHCLYIHTNQSNSQPSTNGYIYGNTLISRSNAIIYESDGQLINQTTYFTNNNLVGSITLNNVTNTYVTFNGINALDGGFGIYAISGYNNRFELNNINGLASSYAFGIEDGVRLNTSTIQDNNIYTIPTNHYYNRLPYDSYIDNYLFSSSNKPSCNYVYPTNLKTINYWNNSNYQRLTCIDNGWRAITLSTNGL
jgi:hypothetical protein